MSRLSDLGRLIVAGCLVAFGIEHIVAGSFPSGLEPIPLDFPARVLFAWTVGIGLAAAGASIATRWYARAGAVVAAAIYGIALLVLHLPHIVAHPHDGSVRTGFFELLAIGAALIILAGRDGSTGVLSRAATPARLAFAVALVVFGIDHYIYAAFVATLIPSWIPGHLAWTYITGAVFIVAAASIATLWHIRLAASLLGLMFLSWALLLHAPRVAASPYNLNEWSSAIVALMMCGCTWVLAGGATDSWQDVNRATPLVLGA